MKSPVLTTKKLDSFINAADGGTPSEKPKKKAVRNGFNFTERQREVFYKIKEVANKSSVEVLLFLALEYSKENPFSYDDYLDFMDLLTEKNKKIYKTMYTKGQYFEEYDQITAKIKSEFMNIPLKGVVLMYLLHYAKYKLNMDISEFM